MVNKLTPHAQKWMFQILLVEKRPDVWLVAGGTLIRPRATSGERGVAPHRPPGPPAPPGGRVLLRGSGGVADCDSLRLSKGQWSLVCRFPLRIGNQDAATGTAARRAPPLTTKLAAEPPQTPDRTERSRRPFGWPWPLRHSRSGPRGCHAFKGPAPGLSSASPHAFSSLTPRPPSRARLRSVLVSHIG